MQSFQCPHSSSFLSFFDLLEKAKYEAELKFTNLNVQDVFRGNKTQDILDIFKERLWKDSSDVYITRIVAPTDVGGRLPVDPKDKEGWVS